MDMGYGIWIGLLDMDWIRDRGRRRARVRVNRIIEFSLLTLSSL